MFAKMFIVALATISLSGCFDASNAESKFVSKEQFAAARKSCLAKGYDNVSWETENRLFSTQQSRMTKVFCVEQVPGQPVFLSEKP